MAVYTEVPDDALEAFVAEYDIGRVLSCKGIAEGVENSNYLLQTEHGRYILTLYEKRVNPDDLPYFLGLLEHLATNEIPCPTVLQGRDGTALRKLCNRPAAVFSFLEGMSPRRIQPNHCAELGNALARLHIAGADFQMSRKNSLSLDNWRPLLVSCGLQIDTIRYGLINLLTAELDFLENSWPKDLPAGICHADLFPDNVFFLGGNLSGLIDFYFACNDFLAYDLAICMNAWCFERDSSFNSSKARKLLSNYRKTRNLDEAEMLALPILARGSALRFLLTRLYDWINHPASAMVRPKNPLEYIEILSFHQKVSDPGEYGLK